MTLAARCLDAPPPGWRELLAVDPAAAYAQRPALWASLTAALPSLSLRCLVVEEEGSLLGGMPVFVERRGGFHWLHVLPYLLPGAPLARPGRHAEVDAAAGAGLAELQRELRAVGGEWALYRSAGPPVAPAALALPTGETRMLEAAVVDLEAGIEAAWARLDRKTRHDLRQARARLAVAEEAEAVDEVYALHLAQARAWPAHAAPPLALCRRLLEDPGDGFGPVARLFTVRRGRDLLCGALVLDQPRESMPWWSGADPEARRERAFGVLLWSVVEWAARAGRVRVSLGGSAGSAPVAAFKDSLGARVQPYPVRWLDAAAAGEPGRWVAALQRRARAGRRLGEKT